MLTTPDDQAPPQKKYPSKALFRVLCPRGFNDGNLRQAAKAEDVELPWRHGLVQTVSGGLINKMLASGAELDVFNAVVPPSTKSKVEDGENGKKEEGKNG